MVALEPTERAKLRRFLVDHFDLNEQKDLAFDLGVDYQLFSHQTTQGLARELITYFERRSQLSSLVAEVLRQRYDDDLAQLLAKLPPRSPRKKIQIFVTQDLLEDVSGLRDELAAKLKLPNDEVALICAAGGSMRLLVGLPERAADLRILSDVHSLGAGRHQVISITNFDSLDSASQKAWRLVARNWPPVFQGSLLRPAVYWQDAFEAAKEASLAFLSPPNEQSYYLQVVGTSEMLNRIGRDHALYHRVLGHQQQLSENIKQSQLRGDSDKLRSERCRIINELNKLAVCVLGMSFAELCAQIPPTLVQDSTERLPYISDPLPLVRLGPEGTVRHLIEDVIRARSHASCEETLRFSNDAVQYASKHGGPAELALTYLYQADAQARNNRLEVGIKLAERARRILQMRGDHHNTMVARLLAACFQATQDVDRARLEYLEALSLCRKLESEKKETTQSEEAQPYKRIIEEIQQVLKDLNGVAKERVSRYLSSSIPILRLSDGPEAISRPASVVNYTASGQFRIEGRTYFPYPLYQTEEHTSKLKADAVHFALRVPEDGWLDPASKEGDYVLVQQEPKATEEGPAVLWTENEWVTGRFEQDRGGNIRFLPQPARIIGSQKVKPRKAVALLKRAPKRSP
jgi:SOS-response transcriptional repressor LexA